MLTSGLLLREGCAADLGKRSSAVCRSMPRYPAWHLVETATDRSTVPERRALGCPHRPLDTRGAIITRR